MKCKKPNAQVGYANLKVWTNFKAQQMIRLHNRIND